MESVLLCVIGNARSQSDNPITHLFSSFFITFIVESETGIIVEAEPTVVLQTTKEFLKTLFVGRSLKAVDEDLEEDIKRRYLGSSQKAILVAYKDAVKKYRAWCQGITITD